ncbi:MAG: methyltransferase domain-containing protein [Betaproteobacteria bacterium]
MNQRWDPGQYATNARFVSDLASPVVELLAPRAGERILDLGCGDGVLTKRLADLGCILVGVDASPEMVAASRALGLDAQVADGHALAFDDEFDAVFSNAALHWLRQPATVVAGVWKALKPGGRFVAECGGRGNSATVVAALESSLLARGVDPHACNPWYFASVDEYRQVLDGQGFAVASIALHPRPTPLPGSLVRWLETFAQSFAATLPARERASFLDEVAEKCRGALCDEDGRWSVDYVRLRFSAIKPGQD